MITHTATTETKTELKPKKKQVQPLHHASKSKQAAKLRRQKIINAIIEGKTHKEAGIIAGLSPNSAGEQVAQILKEPSVRGTLSAAMEKLGIDDDFLVEHHRQLIEGIKVISANIILPGSQTDLKDAGSITKDFIEVPDYVAKAKGLDMVYRLLGRYKNRTEVDIKEPVNIIIKKFCSRTTAQDAVGLD